MGEILHYATATILGCTHARNIWQKLGDVELRKKNKDYSHSVLVLIFLRIMKVRILKKSCRITP